MSKKRASPRPAVKLDAARLLDVAEFFFEAVDIALVEPDAILERPQAFGNTGVIGLRPETHILLRSKLLFRNVQLLLFLGQFLLQNFAPAGVALLLCLTVNAREIGRFRLRLLRLAARRGGLDRKSTRLNSSHT